MSDANNDLTLVQQYRELVLQYEQLDEEIDTLIMANGGGTEHMSTADLNLYRELASHRTEVRNDMRLLEHALEIDD